MNKIPKKASGLPMNILIICIILLVALIIYLAVFTGLFKKEGGQIDCQIDNLEDSDEDGVINVFDKCCNTPDSKKDEVASDGCAAEGDTQQKCPCK